MENGVCGNVLYAQCALHTHTLTHKHTDTGTDMLLWLTQKHWFITIMRPWQSKKLICHIVHLVSHSQPTNQPQYSNSNKTNKNIPASRLYQPKCYYLPFQLDISLFFCEWVVLCIVYYVMYSNAMWLAFVSLLHTDHTRRPNIV